MKKLLIKPAEEGALFDFFHKKCYNILYMKENSYKGRELKMNKLYFNNQYIISISSFHEVLERQEEGNDSTVTAHLSIFIRDTQILDDFNIELFNPFMQTSSISEIVIKNNEDRIIYRTANYDKVYSVSWFLDDDMPSGASEGKINIHLIK